MFTWKLTPRPYSDEEAKELLTPLMSPETTEWHYRKHHSGYVVALNTIEKELQNVTRDGSNGNYSGFGELKRRQPFNHAGTILHDVYWMNVGGNGDVSKAPQLFQKIEEEFGSFEAWKEDMIATGMAAKLGGWAVLTLDTLISGRLLNILVDEHQNGALWGGIPIVALDMFEHAYYHQDGPARPAFINHFFESLHWERIEALYTQHSSSVH
ncbi:superoxide dismutase [Candidatus Peregrinibacteria bacterium]|nr:MAG: superoxide dismutase [Candidatus Peregrinibacteria bacterium]